MARLVDALADHAMGWSQGFLGDAGDAGVSAKIERRPAHGQELVEVGLVVLHRRQDRIDVDAKIEAANLLEDLVDRFRRHRAFAGEDAVRLDRLNDLASRFSQEVVGEELHKSLVRCSYDNPA
jgi:hypothetical protein